MVIDAQYETTTPAFRLTATPTTGYAYPSTDPSATGSRPQAALLQADTHDLRFTTDGSTPTASYGMLLTAGDPPMYYAGPLNQLQFIQTESGSKLNVTYLQTAFEAAGPTGAQGAQGPAGPSGSTLTLEDLAALGVYPCVIGRPKLDDDTTFYGIPFAPAYNGGWTSFPSFSGDGNSPAFEQGKIIYAPFPLLQSIHIDELVLTVDSAASDDELSPITDDLRIAIVRLDKDWRPTGDPVFQTVVSISESGQVEVAVDMDIDSGMYAVAIEEEFGDPEIANTITLQSIPNAFPGSYLCSAEGDPGSMIQFFVADHVYAPLSNPMPVPDAFVSFSGDPTSFNGMNAPLIPVTFEWTPL